MAAMATASLNGWLRSTSSSRFGINSPFATLGDYRLINCLVSTYKRIQHQENHSPPFGRGKIARPFFCSYVDYVKDFRYLSSNFFVARAPLNRTLPQEDFMADVGGDRICRKVYRASMGDADISFKYWILCSVCGSIN